MMFISIPAKFEDKLLTIKALKITGIGETPELALYAAIKSTALCDSLIDSKIEESYNIFHDIHNLAIIAPLDDILLTEINRIEPVPESKPKYKGLLTPPSAEEVIRYGS